ncbi:hypothetical protein AVEN_92358-1 [Araneus ventricosus]|uniref:Uncharacterized protein n=1 Tax=Araneus ventricosus TaxID=182803 RepID=A0A4Y2AJI0_ARAVE|nr:hypothetical protein AVEN_92358-1 [Araneus ventricosus]
MLRSYCHRNVGGIYSQMYEIRLLSLDGYYIQQLTVKDKQLTHLELRRELKIALLRIGAREDGPHCLNQDQKLAGVYRRGWVITL